MQSSVSERVKLLDLLPRFVSELDVIKEIAGIMKPYLPSLDLLIETMYRVESDSTYVRLKWQWMNHATYETPEPSLDELMNGTASVVRRIYQAGKVSYAIDISNELYQADPYVHCAQKVIQELDLQKQEIVEAITNMAIFGKEVTS